MTTRDTDPAVPGFDPAVAHPARVYNVWLGGKDHYAPDRAAAQRVVECRPQVVAGARANRQFLGRVVRHLAGQRGISQFLDIGTGLPAPDNTHEVAQSLNPAARIVYADNDPLVLTHARALLTGTPEGSCDYLDADLHDPAAILAGAARTLDLARPAAILLLAVLHFLPEADDPAGIVATLAAGLAPGSFVAVTHLTSDFAPAAVASGVAAYNEAVPRTDHRPLARPGHRPARWPAPGPARSGAGQRVARRSGPGAPARRPLRRPRIDPREQTPARVPTRHRANTRANNGSDRPTPHPGRRPAPAAAGGPGADGSGASPRTRPGGEPAADAGDHRPADRGRADRLPQRHPRHP